MSQSRSPLFWLRWLVLVVAIAWFWFAPRRSWHQFLGALDDGSVEQLNQVVNLPRLQASLRIDLAAAVMNHPGTETDTTRQAATRGFLPSLVEAASSPTGIQQTVAGFGYTGPGALVGPTPLEVSFHYRSPLVMEVRMHQPGTPESETGLINIELTGAHWQVTRIRSVWLAERQP